MESDLISLALALVVAAAVVFPLGGALKRRPWAFYLAAGVVVGLYAYYQYLGAFGERALQLLAEPLRKGYIASLFLAAVMFCGTLAPGSALRGRLQPIRAELSILSLIMYLPHIVAFLPGYLPRLGAMIGRGNLMSYSIVVALVLTAVYALLSVLSLHVVRVRMPFKAWKAVQRLSYAMVGLLGVHVWLALGRGALRGGSPDATAALVVYTAVIVLYAVLRVRRAVIDSSAAPRPAQAAPAVEGA